MFTIISEGYKKMLEIPLSYENIIINQYNNPYNHEKFLKICGEYKVSNDLTEWRFKKYCSMWQSRAWETGKPGISYINENSFSRWAIEKSNGLTTLGLQELSEAVRNYPISDISESNQYDRSNRWSYGMKLRCSTNISKYFRKYHKEES